MSIWLDSILARTRTAYSTLPLQVKYAKALELRGYQHLDTKGRYVVYTAVIAASKIYIGLSGSVRIGYNRTTSRPMQDIHKKQLIEEFNAWAHTQLQDKQKDTPITMISL